MWLILWLLTLQLSAFEGSKESEQPVALPNIEMGASALIEGCVNAITGDYIEAATDLVVVSPEPLVFSRSHSSSDLTNRHLYSGWRHHLGGAIVATVSKEDKGFRAFYIDHAGQSAVYRGTYQKKADGHRAVKAYFDPEENKIGFTNSSSGVISARTNPKNTVVEHHHEKSKTCYVKPASGIYSEFQHDKDLQILLLKKETSPNGFTKDYTYDKEGCLEEVHCYGPQGVEYNWLKLEYNEHQKEPHFKLSASDGREITYQLTKMKKHRSEKKKHERSRYYIAKVLNSRAPEVNYEYADAEGATIGAMIVKRTLPEERLREITYWDEKHIHQGSFKHNRVRQILAPIGEDSTPLIQYRFGYERDHTIVHDAEDHLTYYHYDNQERLTSIVKKKANQTYTTQEFFWGKGERDGYLEGKAIKDEEENYHQGRFLDYDESGNIVRDTLYGQITGESGPLKIKLKTQRPASQEVDAYGISYVYSQDSLHHLLEEQHDNGKAISYRYYPNTDLLQSKCVKVKGKNYERQFFDYDKYNQIKWKITDDGSSETPEDLTDVTERRITRYFNKRADLEQEEAPLGLPLEIEESYLDLTTGKERLLSRKVHHYSPFGELLSQEYYDSEDQYRYALNWKYDAHGNVIEETDPLGQKITRSYDLNDNLIEETGPALTKRYKYDYANRLIEEKSYGSDGIRQITRHRYDLRGNRIATTDPFGNTTKYKYDPFNRLICTTDPAGNKTTLAYNPLNHLVSHTDPAGNTTLTETNIHGKPLKITYPDGTTSTCRYHLDGTLFKQTNRQGVLTHYEIDCLGRILSQKTYSSQGELLSQERFEYNAFHLIAATNPEGVRTEYHYDSAGRLVALHKGLSKTTYGYDNLGQLSLTCEYYTPENYKCTQKIYDLLNRPLEEIVTEGETGEVLRQVSWNYNASNQVIAEMTSGTIRRTEYDSHGNLKRFIDPEGNITTYQHDYNSVNDQEETVYTLTVIDALGIQTITRHNPLGQIERICKKDPFGALLSKQQFLYSPLGDRELAIETVFIPGEKERQIQSYWERDFEHKLLKQVEAKDTPQQKTLQIAYNSLGQKAVLTKPDGLKIAHTYDSKGRLFQITASDHSIDYQYFYDQADELIQVKDLVHQTELLRDYHQGQLIQEILSNGLNISYKYDLLQRPIELLLPEETTLTYSYTATQLSQVKRKGTEDYTHTYVAYDLFGNLTQALLPKECGQALYTYDRNQRLLTSKTGTYTQQLHYDSVGNLIQTKTQQGTATYQYDPLNQLTEEESETNHTYRYDSLHNCIEKDGSPRTLNALHQLLQAGDHSYTYDPNGNRLTSPDTTYAYDAFDRLTTLTRGSMRWDYTYDAFHRRLTSQKWIKTGDHWLPQPLKSYLYQGENEVGCYENGSALELRLLGVGKGAEIGATIAIELQKQLFIPTHDHNGSIVELRDSTGETVESYRYTAFGEEKIYSDNQTALNPWRFSSKRIDETGLVYFGRRYYEPHLGRWLTPDPLGYEAGPNAYVYLSNNPLTHIDLYGLYEEGFMSRMGHYAYHLWDTYLAQPGRLIESIGQHFIPIPYIRDIVSMCGTVLAGKHFHETPLRHEVHSYYGTTGDAQLLRDDVRMITCNGILNTSSEVRNHSTHQSHSLMGQFIHYVYNATHGFMTDVTEAAAQLLGIPTNSVKQMTACLNQHLAEVGPKGRIILKLHSQGGRIGDSALRNLTPSQRSQIEVYTFGSAKMIDGERLGLARVVNYVSDRDPVPFVTDPLGVGRGWWRGDGSVQFLPSINGSFFDHGINDATYAKASLAVDENIIQRYSR